jgi:hypothetical protein
MARRPLDCKNVLATDRLACKMRSFSLLKRKFSINPSAVLSPTSLDFGNQAVATTSTVQIVIDKIAPSCTMVALQEAKVEILGRGFTPASRPIWHFGTVEDQYL